MKTLALFSLSLAVTLGMPPSAPGAEQTPGFNEQEQRPQMADWVPVQGHVVVEDPAPQVRPGPEEQKEVLAPAPVDMKQRMVEQEIKAEPQVKEEQEGEVKTEIKKEPDVKEDLEADEDPEVKLKSEVKPDVQEQFHVQMNLEAETETSQDIKERHIDMEGKYEIVGEPIMELEPLDDDNMKPSEVVEGEGLMSQRDSVLDEEPIMELEPLDYDDMFEEKLSNMELSDMEKSLRAAFQNQNPVNQPPSEGEEGRMWESNNVLDEEPIMELEPLDQDNMELSAVEKSLRAAFQNQNPVNHPLPEDEGLVSERDNVLAEEPIMELEPLDDDSMSGEKLSSTELSDMEKSLRAAFQNQNLVNQGEPIVELEPEGL